VFLRVSLLLLLSSILALAATFKLYLKDGDYHMVREYQVLDDRIRYFSTERGDWEEIPKELVDLDKTEKERKKTADTAKEQSQLIDAESKAEREERREIARIPLDAGAYWMESGLVKTMELADWKTETSNKRHVLQMVTPLPVVLGKATVTVKGESAAFHIANPEPEFYLRLDRQEGFGIIRLTPNKKGQRIVENVSTSQVTKENFEDQKQVEIYMREMTPGLFKVWPAKPLEPGEYALVQFTSGEVNLRVWDFALQPPPKQ
jgi:hypothetical protein